MMGRFTKPITRALTGAAILIIGVVDYWTGPHVGFSLFYLVPIVYPITLVRELQDRHPDLPVLSLYEANPMTQFVEAFRDVLYALQFPSAGRLGYLTVLSLLVLVGGWALFERGSRDVSEEL